MMVSEQQPQSQSEENQSTSDGPVTRLDLTPEEGEALTSVLDNYLSDLRYEIANTDSNEFRHMLQRRRHVLTGVLDKVRQVGTEAAGAETSGTGTGV